MSFTISLAGHGADIQDVQEVFENAVRGLRAVTPAGSSPISGSLSGDNVSLSAGDVADIGEPADAGEDDQPDTAEPAADEAASSDEPSDEATS